MLPVGKRSLRRIRKNRDRIHQVIDLGILLEYVLTLGDLPEASGGDTQRGDSAPADADLAGNVTAQGGPDTLAPVEAYGSTEDLAALIEIHQERFPRIGELTDALATRSALLHTRKAQSDGPLRKDIDLAAERLFAAVEAGLDGLSWRVARQVRGRNVLRTVRRTLFVALLLGLAYFTMTGGFTRLRQSISSPETRAALKGVALSGLEKAEALWRSYEGKPPNVVRSAGTIDPDPTSDPQPVQRPGQRAADRAPFVGEWWGTAIQELEGDTSSHRDVALQIGTTSASLHVRIVPCENALELAEHHIGRLAFRTQPVEGLQSCCEACTVKVVLDQAATLRIEVFDGGQLVESGKLQRIDQ